MGYNFWGSIFRRIRVPRNAYARCCVYVALGVYHRGFVLYGGRYVSWLGVALDLSMSAYLSPLRGQVSTFGLVSAEEHGIG